jgi:hypothetical protein
MEQLVDSADAQAVNVDRPESLLGHRAANPGRHVAAGRQQGRDQFTIQASVRETNRRKRRCVQPLHVVDCQAEWIVAGEQPQGSQEGSGDRALIGVELGIAKQQRRLERPRLDRRQLGQKVAGGIAEEVGQPREREAGLGLRGSS